MGHLRPAVEDARCGPKRCASRPPAACASDSRHGHGRRRARSSRCRRSSARDRAGAGRAAAHGRAHGRSRWRSAPARRRSAWAGSSCRSPRWAGRRSGRAAAGPATRAISFSSLGPTPASVRVSAKRGNRIAGRMMPGRYRTARRVLLNVRHGVPLASRPARGYMPPMTAPPAESPLEIRRKRLQIPRPAPRLPRGRPGLRHLCGHRDGRACREAEMDQFEALLDAPDQEVWLWLQGKAPCRPGSTRPSSPG